MTAVVFKYSLQPQHINTVVMPAEAKILDVQGQRDTVVIWALVDPENPSVSRTFKTYSTGTIIHGGLQYIGTAQLHDGYTVIHVFEED